MTETPDRDRAADARYYGHQITRRLAAIRQACEDGRYGARDWDDLGDPTLARRMFERAVDPAGGWPDGWRLSDGRGHRDVVADAAETALRWPIYREAVRVYTYAAVPPSRSSESVT